MRSNVFKKALIMAAAAFVTAVIGIGGAKLKVQAAEHLLGTSANLLMVGDYYEEGVEIYYHSGNSFDIYYYNDSTMLDSGKISSLDGTDIGVDGDETENLAANPDGSWWVFGQLYESGSTRILKFYKATEYTVQYKNDDGTVLQSTSEYSGRNTPTCATPTKTATAQYTYTFSGWDPVVAATVTADATYTAQYTPTTRNYNITWKNDDGSTLRTDSVAYGSLPSYGGTPSKPDDANYTYTFSMWNPTVQLVTGDATYTAVYLQDPKPATGGGSEPDSSSGDGSGDGSSTTGTDGSTTGNRAPKTADTMPGFIVIALAGILGGALLITGSRKSSNR